MRDSVRMKTARVLLGLVGGVGLILALTPGMLFPVCSEQIATAGGGFVPMKCAWTARMLIAFGVLTAGIVLMGAFASRLPAMRASAWSAVGVLVVAGLVPTKIIGVCSSLTHPCRAGTLPAVLAETTLGLLLAVSAVVLTTSITHRRNGEAGHQ